MADLEPEKEIVMGKDMTLDEWLSLMSVPIESRKVDLLPDYCFPSTAHKDEYLANIQNRDPEEVKSLIHNFRLNYISVAI